MKPSTLDAWMAARTGLAEPLTRAAIAHWQIERLRVAVAYAYAASPFYRARGEAPDIAMLADLERLPFATAADLTRNDPPLLAASQSDVSRVVTLASSGTSGAPKRVHFSAQDREATLDFFHHGMGLFTRPGDRVAIAFPGGHVAGVADSLAIALRRLSAEPLQAPSPSDPLALAKWLSDERPDVIAGPPIPLLAAVRVAAAEGRAPLAARALLLSSDHVAESVARALAAAFGAEVFRHWGMTETGYGGAVECACHAGCHLRENELLVEIVDPATGAPQPPGALGEIVVTTLSRRAVPLLRYRTGDLARRIEEPCLCGSALSRLDDFSGRLDERVRLPGGDLTLPRLDEALFALEAVCDFAAVFEARAAREARGRHRRPGCAAPRLFAQAAYAALQDDPVIAAAAREGRLQVEVTFAEATLIPRPGKRRLDDPEVRDMRALLLIRHGAMVGDADRRFLGATDSPMSEAANPRFARSPSACASATPCRRFIAAISAARAARRNAWPAARRRSTCGRPCAK